MVTPIDPALCKNTGRLLTEWFEYPEFTEEDLRTMARDKAGVPHDHQYKYIGHATPEERHIQSKISGFIAAMKNRKWGVSNMNKQEVAARLNEATKMIDPSNYKFLDDPTRERTGLELNPLWMMECIVRSGTLSPKEQIQALKELAQYTHSKAPNVNHNTNITAPEDWLLELTKNDYAIVDDLPNFQPKTPRERGMGTHFEKRKAATMKALEHTQGYMQSALSEMEAELGDNPFGEEDP